VSEVRALSPQGVARRFSVSRKLVYKHLESGELRGAKLGSRWSVLIEDADAWWERHVVGRQVAEHARRRRVPAGPGPRQRGSFRALLNGAEE
jgi:excisionase family DNA binding protein